MSDLSIPSFIISALCGGLAGGFLSSRISTRRSKSELSLKFINELFDSIEEIEEAYRILEFDTTDYGLIDITKKTRDENEQKMIEKKLYDTVVKIGDRFDLISFFYLRCKLDRELMDNSNAMIFITNFIKLLKLTSFKPSKYDFYKLDKDKKYERQYWDKNWPNLRDFGSNKSFFYRRFLTFIFG